MQQMHSNERKILRVPFFISLVLVLFFGVCAPLRALRAGSANIFRCDSIVEAALVARFASITKKQSQFGVSHRFRALAWRGATLRTQAQPSITPHRDIDEFTLHNSQTKRREKLFNGENKNLRYSKLLRLKNETNGK